MDSLPLQVIDIAKNIAENGGRAMLVGGCVRDELMGIEPKDWDVEVYGVAPEKLRGILDSFGQVNVVGEAFTVYKLGNDLDVSLPRRERKVGHGHRGFVVEGDPNMSFEEACSRRDFTVNAILKDPLTGEIIDPFDGRSDLGSKVLRHVSADTFAEDSLRVLRAAQFAARFEFDIALETVDLCKTIDVTDLPKERIWGELEKLLLIAARPSIGLKWLYDLGVVDLLFPEMKALVGVPQEAEWHPEGNVDVHTMMVADEARKLIDDLTYERQVAVMIGALAHSNLGFANRLVGGALHLVNKFAHRNSPSRSSNCFDRSPNPAKLVLVHEGSFFLTDELDQAGASCPGKSLSVAAPG